jgi:hypothetical protein
MDTKATPDISGIAFLSTDFVMQAQLYQQQIFMFICALCLREWFGFRPSACGLTHRCASVEVAE